MKKLGGLVIVVFIALVAVGGFYFFSNPSQSTDDPVRIAIDVFPGWGHAFVAEAEGFFAAEGVEVELVLRENYLDAQQLYIDGEVDGVFLVFADAIYLADQGVMGRVVYVSDQSVTGDVIVARPDIKSLQELKGKTVGVEGVNSFSHLFLLTILERDGMKEGDIFVKSVGAQEVVGQISSGEIVAGHTYGPGKSQAVALNYSTLAFSGEVPGVITDTLVIQEDVIRDRPEDTQSIVSALVKAREFQRNNVERAAEIIARKTGDTPRSVKDGIAGVRHLSLEEMVTVMHPSDEKDLHSEQEHIAHLYGSHSLITDFYLSRGQISSVPDFDALVDGSFARSILQHD